MTTHRPEIEDVGVTLRVPAMADVVSQRLRRRIVRGELSEGDVLSPESELMTEFSVSRRPLREAFRVLESEGLLTVRRGVYGGAVVQIPNGDIAAGYASLVLEFRGTTLRDLLDALLVIESGCAALLARRSSPADIARLRDAHASAPASVSDGNALICVHDDFHAMMIDLVDNRTMSLLGGMVRRIVTLATFDHAASDVVPTVNVRSIQHGLRAHEVLIEQIEAGDAEAAETEWRKHLVEGEKNMLGDADRTAALHLLG